VLESQGHSGWRNFRKCRVSRRPVGRARKHAGLNMLGLFTETCGVWLLLRVASSGPCFSRKRIVLLSIF
jgi:hypothetical protein